ncbi:hypothetical protein GGX14DRAFT_391486 [Mycena pura]|uniref:Uncharacterized protein n=1 Tax=Mycena pura TaxID=153505 RepID=A0AAD6YIB5_9AGAR|nr:hypothetical protein GGX14DRAFT_391486 [Mycena pura]
MEVVRGALRMPLKYIVARWFRSYIRAHKVNLNLTLIEIDGRCASVRRKRNGGGDAGRGKAEMMGSCGLSLNVVHGIGCNTKSYSGKSAAISFLPHCQFLGIRLVRRGEVGINIVEAEIGENVQYLNQEAYFSWPWSGSIRWVDWRLLDIGVIGDVTEI